MMVLFSPQAAWQKVRSEATEGGAPRVPVPPELSGFGSGAADLAAPGTRTEERVIAMLKREVRLMTAVAMTNETASPLFSHSRPFVFADGSQQMGTPPGGGVGEALRTPRAEQEAGRDGQGGAPGETCFVPRILPAAWSHTVLGADSDTAFPRCESQKEGKAQKLADEATAKQAEVAQSASALDGTAATLTKRTEARESPHAACFASSRLLGGGNLCMVLLPAGCCALSAGDREGPEGAAGAGGGCRGGGEAAQG